MKIIEVEKKETLENIENIGPNWKFDTIQYILTFLANLPSGCIIAEWSKTENKVTWFYSTAPCTSIKPEKLEGKLFTLNDRIPFRALLGTLGMTILEEGYLGAGTFKICFKNESSTSKLLAIIFSNKQEIGHWIKLQVIE